LAVSASDFFASTILKPLIKRLRPSHEPALQNLVRTLKDYSGSEYGMASSHAANAFAFSMILWLFFHKKIKFLWLIFVWSFTVAYSRVYIGVHYPSDILVGAIIGIGCAYFSKNLFIYLKLINNP
jgi:undecaprenyl-diphosphatase